MSPLALQVDDVEFDPSTPRLTELIARRDRAIKRAPSQWVSFLASQGLSIIRHWR